MDFASFSLKSSKRGALQGIACGHVADYKTPWYLMDLIAPILCFLHSIYLQMLEESEQHLIFICKVSIFEDYLQAPYTYCRSGHEESAAISVDFIIVVRICGMYVNCLEGQNYDLIEH